MCVCVCRSYTAEPIIQLVNIDHYYSIYAVTVTWNGTNITGRPTLIYHDEVTAINYRPPPTLHNPNSPGGLLCNSTVGPISWWGGTGVTDPPLDTNVPLIFIYQIIPSGNLTAQIVTDGRNVDVLRYSFHNGLFTCRRNGDILTAVPVGFYARGEMVYKGTRSL